MLENCKQSLPVIQGIVESTVDDEGLLFEALSIHDELQQIISRYQQMEDPLVPGGTEPKHGGAGGREPDASGIKEGSSLVQVQNQSETERTEVSKVESGSDNLRSVLLESGGVEGGAKERLDAH